MCGMMSDTSILHALKNGEMIITPFDVMNPDKRLTPAGFNFSFTRFIVSINKRMFYKVFEEPSSERQYSNIYFTLEAGDTALALTRESIWVPKNIAGTFHSKVGYVSQGLGHISTTLDPGWMGQLLISVNNPNREPIRVLIGTKRRDNGRIDYCTFITLCLYKLCEPATNLSDNSCARLDILFDILKGNAKPSIEFDKLMDSIHELQKKITARCLKHPYGFNDNSPTPNEVAMYKDDHDKLIGFIDDLQPDIEKAIEAVERNS